MPVAEIGGKSILFIHIPKTAGMAVGRFLSDNGALTADGYLRAYGRRIRLRHLHRAPLESLYRGACFDWVFAVVRDPVARMVSEYRYQRRKGGLHPQNLMPFGLWLRYWLARAARDPSCRENHFRPQSDFLAFGAEVFRIEDGLAPLQARLSEVTGLADPVPIGRENASPRREVAVSAADRARIAAHFAADYEAFGYDT